MLFAPDRRPALSCNEDRHKLGAAPTDLPLRFRTIGNVTSANAPRSSWILGREDEALGTQRVANIDGPPRQHRTGRER